MRVPDDEDRLETLLKECEPRVRAYIRRRASPHVDVEDVLEEAYIVAWLKSEAFLAADSPLAWLLKVASRRWVDAERKAARRRRAETSYSMEEAGVHTDNPVDRLESNARLEEVLEALSLLRDVDRQLILLASQDDLSHKHIAAIFGWTVKKVDQRLHRARHRLKARTREIRMRRDHQQRSDQ